MVDWGSEIIINGVFERHKFANSALLCAEIGQVWTPRTRVYHARIKHDGAISGVSGVFTCGNIRESPVGRRSHKTGAGSEGKDVTGTPDSPWGHR